MKNFFVYSVLLYVYIWHSLIFRGWVLYQSCMICLVDMQWIWTFIILRKVLQNVSHAMIDNYSVERIICWNFSLCVLCCYHSLHFMSVRNLFVFWVYFALPGLTQEGLFRVNGNVKVVEQLRLKFESGVPVELGKDGDVCSAASLLKLFLRELPDSLITSALQPRFIQLFQG